MFKFFIIFFAIPCVAFSDVALLGAENQKLNFQTYVHKNEGVISYAQHQVITLRSQVNTDQLLDDFENAQLQFFSGEYEKSKLSFEKIIATGELHLLPEKFTDVISMSYLRRAALESQHHRQMYWLKKGFLYNPEHTPIKDLFSTDIMNKWRHIKTTSPRVKLTLTQDFKDFEYLVIFNTLFDLRKTKNITWPEGVVSIMALSSRLKPIEFKVSLHDLKQKKITQKPLLTSHCDHIAAIDSRFTRPPFVLFFNKNCIAKFKAPVTLAGVLPKSIEPQDIPFITQPMPSSKVWYKNKWLWGAAVTAGYFYLKSKNNKDLKQRVIYEPPHPSLK